MLWVEGNAGVNESMCVIRSFGNQPLHFSKRLDAEGLGLIMLATDVLPYTTLVASKVWLLPRSRWPRG